MSPFIRQFHRWTSIAFVVGVLTYIVAMSGGQQPSIWIGLMAAGPLVLLLLTGLYLFALPYVRRLRGEAA